MSTSSKRKLMLSSVSVHIGCSSCKRPNLSAIFTPFPKLKKAGGKTPAAYHQNSTGSLTPTPTTTTSTTATSSTEYQWESDKSPPPKARGLESVAVEKDSDDPYLDFRQSMLQMILENEIYTREGLRELLRCFLQLNAPYHHGIIVKAFTEIWDGVFSATAGRGSAHDSDYSAQQHYGRPCVSRDYY